MKFGARVDVTVAVLREWLSKFQIEAGARIPSERRIAVELGKTHYAVNRAVMRLVNEGLIRREGYKLYYTPKSPEPVVAPYYFMGSAGSERAKLLRKTARGLNIDFRVMSWGSVEEASFVLRKVRSDDTKGVIVEAPFSELVTKWKPSVERLLAEQVPCVCLGQPISDVPAVIFDYGAALALAFRHLTEIGHTELALLSPEERAPTVVEGLESWNAECLKANRLSSAKRVFIGHKRSHREDARKFATLLTKEWSNVTGIIAHDRAMAALLTEELARLHRSVPHDISIIALGDSSALKKSSPPISCATFDDAFFVDSALRMLEWMVAKKVDLGRLPRPPQIRIEPQLVLRASTAPRNRHWITVKPDQRESKANLPSAEVWPEDPVRLRHLIESIVNKPYPLTIGTRDSRFQRVDLHPHVNRPLNFRRGWLGDLPLRNLNTGEQRIHGVVFDILGGSSRADFEAVVFQSSKNTTGNRRQLPQRIKVTVGCRARSVYFLHGCGYSGFLQNFASYNFYTRTGLVSSVPLVTLGHHPHEMDAEEIKAAIEKANIQDWWPDFFQTDFAHARRVVVAQDEESLQIHRYLYTLEWINPSPEEEIEYVEVCVVPDQPTTLGLLAISVLKP